MNSSNTSELSIAKFSSDSFNTTFDVAFVTAINESSTSQSNFTDIVSSAVQSTWQDGITQDTYFLVYIGSLAGIILLQLAKGFAGAKVGYFVSTIQSYLHHYVDFWVFMYSSYAIYYRSLISMGIIH